MPVFGKGAKIKECRERSDEVLRLFDRNATVAELEGPTMGTLELLWNEAQDLRDRVIADRKKANGRSSKDYFDGVELGQLAYKIAEKLEERGIKEPQEIALQIRLKVITVVQGHYHHIIGPAMVEYCVLLEDLGRLVNASDHYESMISDFAWIVDEYSGVTDQGFNKEDLLSLGALKTALHNRLKIGNMADTKTAQMQKLLVKTEAILDRP